MKINIAKRGLKVEAFFIISLLLSFFTSGNPLPSIICAFLIPFFFFSRKQAVIVAVILLLLSSFSQYGRVVLDIKNEGYKGTVMFTTPAGYMIAEKKENISPGDLVIGTYEKRFYASSGPEPKKYSSGYYFLNKKICSFRIPLISDIIKIRKKFSDRLFNDSSGRITLTQALLMGDKKHLDPSTSDKFVKTGLAHLLAVSGLHVGIIIGLVIASLFFYPRKLTYAIALILILLFIPLSGFRITVLRAAIIAVVFMGAHIADMEIRFRKLILAMGGFFLLISPMAVFSLSFLMSFAAVFGLSCLDYGKKNTITALKAGVIASAYTLPFSLFAFGTNNITSILTTVIILPFISLQILFGLVSLVFTKIMIEPLALMEKINLGIIGFFDRVTEPFFTLNSFGFIPLILMLIFLAVVGRKKWVWLSAILLILPYIPKKSEEGLYFPLMTRARGFINISKKESEVFFRGSLGEFKYQFLKECARLGIKKFDKGYVSVFGTVNNYLKISKETQNFTDICINEKEDRCKIIYHTRSNTVRKKDIGDGLLHIVYKNKNKGENIVELVKTGTFMLKNKNEKDKN